MKGMLNVCDINDPTSTWSLFRYSKLINSIAMAASLLTKLFVLLFLVLPFNATYIPSIANGLIKTNPAQPSVDTKSCILLVALLSWVYEQIENDFLVRRQYLLSLTKLTFAANDTILIWCSLFIDVEYSTMKRQCAADRMEMWRKKFPVDRAICLISLLFNRSVADAFVQINPSLTIHTLPIHITSHR